MKKNLIKIIVAIVLAVILILLVKSLYEVGTTFFSGEDIFVTEPDVISKSEAPVSTEQIVIYFNKLSDKLKADKPSVELKNDYKVSNSSIEAENKILDKVAPLIKDIIIEKQGSKEKENVTFPNTTNAYPLHIDVNDIRFAISNQEKHTYTLTFFFEDGRNDTVNKYFPVIDKEFVDEGINTAKSYLVVDRYDFDYSDCKIVCVVDRETDEIQSITYSRNINTAVKATGTGILQAEGALDFSFTLEHTAAYSFGWPRVEETTVAE